MINLYFRYVAKIKEGNNHRKNYFNIKWYVLGTKERNGAKNKSKPLAFVGKGVCFDTGGISLKPAKFMEDMTYDMAGSAVVVGLMKSLALRQIAENAGVDGAVVAGDRKSVV